MNRKFLLSLALAPLGCLAVDDRAAAEDAPLTLDSSTLEDTVVKAKSQKAQKLVTDALAFIKKNGIPAACKSFMDDPRWHYGEMYVWIFDSKGTCYCHGFDKSVLWQNFAENNTDDFIKRMLDTGKVGGFVDYKWNNGYSHAYVKNITIGKKTYVVGVSFYPTSPVYVVRELISSAENYLKQTSFNALRERVSNPTGIFVRGDIHLEMYSMDGTCVANGEQVALIGQNLIEAKTGDDKFIVRDLIKIAQTQGEGWYEARSISGDEPVNNFVKKIVDPADGKPYIIVCSYYTNITQDTAIGLVKKAADFLKANGGDVAFRAFSTQNDAFIKGPVTIFVYNMKGTMMADSRNPAFVGLNMINTRDAEGRPVTKQIIEMADKYGKGWVTNALGNSYQVCYCEKVKVPDGDFVIGASYYPVAKESFVRFMIEDAVLYLQNHTLEESLRQFINKQADFLRGDINIFVYTIDGTCLADGINLNKVWANDKEAKDEKGVKVIDKMIAIAKTGGGWMSCNLNNSVCNIYVKTVDKSTDKDKEPELYIVGSGYFE